MTAHSPSQAPSHALDQDADQRFRDWRPLGQGGTAKVFRVYDARLRYDVAIKLLREEILSDRAKRTAMLDSLVNEVRISRELHHENICPVYELYEGARGVGVVMGVVEGEELRAWMLRHADNRLATTPQRLEFLRKLTGALSVAHKLIIHRDLKPGNILLRNGDILKPVIMDFGCAVIGETVGKDSLLSWTLKYAAPEQLSAPHTVDRRADIWALGIIAYELLAGRVPPCSPKSERDAVRRPDTDGMDPPSAFNVAVPAALDWIILKALQPDPEHRVASADEFLAALDRVELVAKEEWWVQGADVRDRRSRAVRVPGGPHYLGSRAGGAANENERPGRRVMLKPFLIDPTPVTNAEYAAFADATGYPPPPLRQRRQTDGDQHPVVGVTHAEASAFARWVGGALPTEAQWEHAARAGTPFAEYPWGNDPPDALRANLAGTAGTTLPVGSTVMGRNAFGLFDMCGNVWEWCRDAYDEGFFWTLSKDAADPCNDRPTGPRTLRGGSFESFASEGRCAFRAHAQPEERRHDVGFRVVYAADA